MGIFQRLLAREGPSSAIFENSRNLASSSSGLGQATTENMVEHGRGVIREPQSSAIPTPRFNQGVATLNPFSHTGGTYSHNGMMGYPRFQISEMHLAKFPCSSELQSWKVNFETEVCPNSAFPHITMHWIKAVETAKSTDDLMTSRSITRRTDFPDYDMLDAMIASELKMLVTSVHFRKRVTGEKQRAQKYHRFLRGKHIAYMIYEHVRQIYSAYAHRMMFKISIQDGTKLY